MSFASEIQAMHLADQHLRMCGPFFKATVSKSRRCWLLITASCVYISTLNSMFLILPQRSVSASTGWRCRGRRTAAVGGDNGNGGPGTTGKIEGKLQKNGSIVWYCGRGHGSFLYRPTSTYVLCILSYGIPAGIPESGIPDQINLALE
jgi:hypothetical protein